MLFPIDEDFMSFEQTPSSSALWSLGHQNPSEPLIADPVPLASAEFWNVSPNPFTSEQEDQSVWTRDTPVLDRFRIGNPSPGQFVENQFSTQQQLADIDNTHMETAEAHTVDTEFSYLAYDEIAHELDRMLEEGCGSDLLQLESGPNPKNDVQVQTDECFQSAVYVKENMDDPRESVCGNCRKPFYNISVEAAGRYIKRTEFEGETVRERELRTKAFFCGIETAVQMFARPVLSQPICCPGATVQRSQLQAVQRQEEALQSTPLSQGITNVIW